MLNKSIKQLIAYGVNCGLITEDDKTYIVNQLIALFDEYEYVEPDEEYEEVCLEEILHAMLDYACEKGIIQEDTIVNRDLFDTKIMSLLVSKPSEINQMFWELYNHQSPKAATDYYYKLSQDTDYIRRYRVEKDMKWITSTEYGGMEITINLSKPEKDPRSIAAAKNAKQTGYPKCLLCIENEGYSGHVNHPPRQNHRIIPITINQEKWGLQYSPYVYYNEHCIVLNASHTPMRIERHTFVKLFDFVKLFPHYFVGSNADLPIVGGSILSHDHFQGGHYEFAMAKAEIEETFIIKGYETIKAGIVNWPMSVIRLCGESCDDVIDLADHILQVYRNYTDERVFLYADTDGEPHNTITPIARMRDGIYELDLVLRNNITTDEHPMGVYHPHAELHHIKKENIGLIEVMGLAVLPSRLKQEMELLADAMVKNMDLHTVQGIEHHVPWALDIQKKYGDIHEDRIMEILKKEIGIVFNEVLLHAGVFKRDEEGKEGFRRLFAAL